MVEKQPHNPEKSAATSHEKLKLNPEHQQRAEVQKQSRAEREHSVEAARDKLKATEHEPRPGDRERASEQPAEKGEPKVISRRERDAVFVKTMAQVRHQLSPAQRTFSKLIHAKPVEAVSELLEETIYRPSFLWGGLIGGLLFGGFLYVVARAMGFRLSGSEFLVGLLVGGCIGFLVEKIIFRFRHRDTPSS